MLKRFKQWLALRRWRAFASLNDLCVLCGTSRRYFCSVGYHYFKVCRSCEPNLKCPNCEADKIALADFNRLKAELLEQTRK